MTKYDFKKRTRFIITEEPTLWDSKLNDNYPLRNKIKYPYSGIIKQIDHPYGAMTDGFYGWSLSALIEENKIKIVNIKEERKKKLIKIYNR